MTRRSAFTVAGGVVAALGAGIVATIVNVGVLNASEPQGPGQLRADEPVVRTVTETRTIHKKAESSSAGSGSVVVKSRPATSAAAPSNGVAGASIEDSYEDDEDYEDESESEDEYEDAEDDEHEFDEGDDD